MQWTEAIFVNLATIAIAAVGVAFTILYYKLDQRNKKREATINKLANQVKAYYELEKLYVNEIATVNGLTAKSVLEKHRRDVEANHPDIYIEGEWITAKKADRYIK